MESQIVKEAQNPSRFSSFTQELLALADKQGRNKGIVLRHIKVSFYKNGTTHIVFLNPGRLLEKFNVFCRIPWRFGTIPPTPGQRAS